MVMDPLIDIVVVDYHTRHDLDRFLESCSVISVPHTVTVILVEADLPPDSDPIHQGREVKAAKDNIGYARACNWGAALGDAPAIGLFNADVIITPGSVEHCIVTLDSSPDIAVVGPRQVNSKGKLTHTGIFGGNKGAKPRAWNERDRGQHVEVEDATSVSGSAYFVRRSVWDEMASCPIYRRIDPGSMGAFLRTPHYYEETWFSYHVRAHGYRVVYDGAVTMIHEWHQASPVGGWAEQQFRVSRQMFRDACDAHDIPRD